MERLGEPLIKYAGIAKTLLAQAWRAVCGVVLLVKGSPFTS